MGERRGGGWRLGHGGADDSDNGRGDGGRGNRDGGRGAVCGEGSHGLRRVGLKHTGARC